MPTNKDLKRLARTRMKKTGESYATARTQLLHKKNHPAPTVVSESGFAALAGMSDQAVKAKTGRTWKQWVRTLDAVDAAKMAHRDIVHHIDENYEVPGWWCQMVTVGYERIRGKRAVGQRCDGDFSVNKSKTVPVSLSKLYRAFSVKRTRERWLPGVGLKVRKSTTDKSMRITWEDGTAVDAYFTAKGGSKSQVALQHRKLADKAQASVVREFWTARLAALVEILRPGK